MSKEDNYEEKRNNNNVTTIILAIVFVLLLSAGTYFLKNRNNQNEGSNVVDSNKYKSEYRINSNSLEPFDLYFLQLENNRVNKIYSPLSIKYTLEMLNEGTGGETHTQISSIIGDYVGNKYINSKNMSFANAMFVKDSYKDTIKEDYINNLKNKYNAEVVYDSYTSVDNINNWISDKTLNLINNALDKEDLGNAPVFTLINALGIDMDWNDKFIHEEKRVWVNYQHERFFWDETDHVVKNKFDNNSQDIASLDVIASLNNYDIVKTLGEDKIRETVGSEYRKYLLEDDWEIENTLKGDTSDNNVNKVINEYLDNYIKEINTNYGKVDYSTDFSLYVDDNVKVFAKDLKEYSGTTLQYVGIMPEKDDLDNYIKNIDSKGLNELIGNLKELKKENFKDGVVTKITGYIPKFKFDYELKLKDDLKSLGVTDVFSKEKANLTNLTTEKGVFIEKASHMANIEFTEDGIKAAATTVLAGGRGAGGFNYLYDVPVEEIDITFDKPYMFLIRNKDSGEVWFMGTVYRPLSWENEAY